MTLDRPYFMENKEWYEDDLESGKLKLTDKAPPKAIQSYKEFYELLEQDLIVKPIKKRSKLNTLVSILQARKIIK